MQQKILIYCLIWFFTQPVTAQFYEEEKLFGEYYLTQKDMEKQGVHTAICIQRRVLMTNSTQTEKLFDTIGYKKIILNEDFKPLFFEEWNNFPYKIIYEYQYSLREVSKMIKKGFRNCDMDTEYNQNYEPIIHLSSKWGLTDSITEYYCNGVKDKINHNIFFNLPNLDTIRHDYKISYNRQKLPTKVNIAILNGKYVAIDTSLIILKYDTLHRLISRHSRLLNDTKFCLRHDFDENNQKNFSFIYDYSYKNQKDSLPYTASFKEYCAKYTTKGDRALEKFYPFEYKPFSIFKKKEDNPYQVIKFKKDTNLPEVITILNKDSVDIFSYQYF